MNFKDGLSWMHDLVDAAWEWNWICWGWVLGWNIRPWKQADSLFSPGSLLGCFTNATFHGGVPNTVGYGLWRSVVIYLQFFCWARARNANFMLHVSYRTASAQQIWGPSGNLSWRIWSQYQTNYGDMLDEYLSEYRVRQPWFQKFLCRHCLYWVAAWL